LTKRGIGSASSRRFSRWRSTLGRQPVKSSREIVSDIGFASVVTELSIQSLMMSWLSSLFASRTARMSIDRPPDPRALRTLRSRLRSVRSLRSLCSRLTRYRLGGGTIELSRLECT